MFEGTVAKDLDLLADLIRADTVTAMTHSTSHDSNISLTDVNTDITDHRLTLKAKLRASSSYVNSHPGVCKHEGECKPRCWKKWKNTGDYYELDLCTSFGVDSFPFGNEQILDLCRRLGDTNSAAGVFGTDKVQRIDEGRYMFHS